MPVVLSLAINDNIPPRGVAGQVEVERTSGSASGAPAVAVTDEGQGAGCESPASCRLQHLGGGAVLPSLVGIGHNSTKHIAKIDTCTNAGWLRGQCKHGTTRWVKLSCKRRDCPVCGEHRKRLIAWRIQLGIERLGGELGAGWFVGSFAYDIEKKQAVKVVGKMVRWLRKTTGVHFEYASTWEVTKAGRLHVNIIMAPWCYIPQSKLSVAWQRFGGGKRVWIERVGAAVGSEVAKAGRERIGNYVAKWDQMVPAGRGVTYSKGWPRLPSAPAPVRQGVIAWRWVGSLELEEILFRDELNYLGLWCEVAPGEYASVWGEECGCFNTS